MKAKTSVAQQVVDYIKDNASEAAPVESKAVIAALGLTSTTVTAALRDKWRSGVLQRREVRRGATNLPRYGYWFADRTPVTPTANKPWKAKPRAKKTPINVSGTIPTTQTLDGMVAEFVDAFVDMLTTALVSSLKPKIEANLREVLPQALPKINAPTDKAVEVLPAKKKVLVVGLLNSQCGHISQEFGEVFDLDFADSDCINGQLRAKVLRSDLVVTMTKFISHASEEVALAAGGNLRRCPGGMSQLRELLTKEYVG